MRLSQVLLARASMVVLTSAAIGCPSPKADPKPTLAEPAEPAEATEAQPGSQPGSSASAAAPIPADHSKSTEPVTLEAMFRMPETPTDKVLRVGGREVTREALERQLRQIQVELSATGSPGEMTRFEVLNGATERLIDIEIRALLGKDLNVKIEPKRVKAWLEALETRTKENPSFETFLLRAGRDKAARKKDAEQAILMEGIIETLQDRARQQILTDAKDYYERHKKDYFERAGREVWRMTIKAPRSMVQRDRDLAKQSAESVYAKVKKDPKNFENFAKSHSQDGKASDGGYLGYLSRGTLIEEVEKQIWAAKDGQVLPMRDAPTGFYIYRVGKKRKDRQKPFEEVEDKILRTIYGASMRKMVDKELHELRESKKVEILIPELVKLRAQADAERKALEERLKKGSVSHTPPKP